MSALKSGSDCCGDMYEVNAYTKCKCGCELFYCRSCFESHMIDVSSRLMKQFSAKELRKILAKEIRKERSDYPRETKFKYKV